MIIYIHKSRLFKEDPSIRFGKEYGVGPDVWRELWKRKQLMEYTKEEMREYFQIKTKKSLSASSLDRWIFRSEIYSMTNQILKKGARAVQSEFFKHHEKAVLDEIMKGARFSATKKVRSLA